MLVNHKPHIPSSFKEVHISKPDAGPDHFYDLSISEGGHDGKYLYRGKKRPSESCALIFDSASQSFVLDAVDDDYAFNLRGTPEDSNAKSWAGQYSQISLDASDHEDDVGPLEPSNNENEDPSAPGDPSNPYDYRHFMNKRRRTSSPEPPASFHPSPAIHSIPSPFSRPSHRTTNAPPRRRSKPHNSVPKPKSAQQPTSLPREETTDADNEDSGDDADNGGLTIDMGDEPAPRRRDRFMGAFGGGTPGSTGPRSLRSAASSVSPVDLNRGRKDIRDDVCDGRHNSDEESEREVTMEDLAEPEVQGESKEIGLQSHDNEADDALEAELAAAMGGSDGEEDEEGDTGGVGLGITRDEESEESEEE